jgi:hypothetical protein
MPGTHSQAAYVEKVLQIYRRTPGTLHRILRDDRKAARELFDRGVALDVVEKALILALVRRTFRNEIVRLDAVRSLRYFLPLIDEIIEAPPDPGYFDHLRHKLEVKGIALEP